MNLYHVSRKNKEKTFLDLSEIPKQDIYFTADLIYKAVSFEQFYLEYNTPMINEMAKKRDWSVEKLATEAIFEYIRQKQCFYKPSRLSSAYFTNSLENAENFNRKQRKGEGAIFSFDADENSVFSFDMDLFHNACTCLELHKLTADTFREVKQMAEKYWSGYNYIDNANCEILYLGLPILTNIKNKLNYISHKKLSE